ncbi:hypothetical protein [Streptomyces sp. NPDC005953]|uniref:hypothetical protein n=1 Tax=Streptomyces sp. NPDC005953 TaxID=3156719 RepID=UPI0033E0A005
MSDRDETPEAWEVAMAEDGYPSYRSWRPIPADAREQLLATDGHPRRIALNEPTRRAA